VNALFATAIATAALAALVPGAWAQQGTLDKIRASGAITIGHGNPIPFSYRAGGPQPVGYAIDLCSRVVDAIKAELNLPELKVSYVLAPSSASHEPLMVAGTTDLDCGGSVNNAERQKLVTFSMTYYVATTRFIARKADNLTRLADLKGKTVAAHENTSDLAFLTELNAAQNLGINILVVKRLGYGLPAVESGKAVAYVHRDIFLAGEAAIHSDPGLWQISSDALSPPQPIAIMLRKDDPAFKKVVDAAMVAIYKSGEGARLYAKWFQSPIPPKGINLNLPLSPMMANLFANPTDSPDPAAYK
jgi:glutamate/aspartate transport system substrate-binding protein